ncbi:hypothetical protein PG991_007153 [Apiospora marii]|uniref:Uncharacterized protein n=1 Tax=Apiospora marii TaxID=335849 RepID=A0ABR1RSQ9_9PEZI
MPVARVALKNRAHLSKCAIDQSRIVDALDIELVSFARAGRPKAEDLMQDDEEDVTIFTRFPQKLVSWSFNIRLQSFNPATLPYLPIENRKSLKGLEES